MAKFARQSETGKGFEYGVIDIETRKYDVQGMAKTLDEAIAMAGMSEVHPNVKRGTYGYENKEIRHSKESIEKAARQKAESQPRREAVQASTDGKEIAVRSVQEDAVDQQV